MKTTKVTSEISSNITSEDFTTLHSLIQSGNLDAVLCHLKERQFRPITYRRYFREETFRVIPSPVSMAAQCGQVDIMKELVSRRFSPREISHGLYPGHLCFPIHFACVMGHLDAVKCLIDDYNIDLTVTDTDFNTPLRIAVASARLDVVHFLLQKGAEFEDIDDLSSALRLSVKMNDANLTMCLVSLSDNFRVNGNTILHDAALTCNIDIVDAILEAGTDVNAVTDVEKETPFLTAVKYGNLAVLKVLHDKGADPEIPDCYGDTALHIATSSSRYDIVRRLVVDLNVELDKKNRNGQTPFSLAVRLENCPLIQLFLDAGFNPVNEPCLLDTKEEILPCLKKVYSNPRTLKELCCFKVRRILGRRLPVVDSLSLPNELKNAVNLTFM